MFMVDNFSSRGLLCGLLLQQEYEGNIRMLVDGTYRNVVKRLCWRRKKLCTT